MIDGDNPRVLTIEDALTPEAIELVKERARLWVECDLDPDKRAAALKLCKEGIPAHGDNPAVPGYLYFFRMFLSIFETRNPPGLQKLPFTPYPYQVEELALIHKWVQGGIGVLGLRTIALWLKSRDMGLTWLVLGYFLWDFLFNKGSFHLGSFKKEEVDVLGSILTLFGKFRFMLYNLPTWMIPAGIVDKFNLISYDDEMVTISGESANPGFGRSKRVKAALMDEFQKWEYDRAALQSISNTCNCLFLVGTPLGYGNYYGEIARGKALKGSFIRRVHWTAHPLKARGLEYRNGKPWSPWYQDQCDKLSPEIIAAELDLSFEQSRKGPVFGDIYGIGHMKRGLIPVEATAFIRGWDLGGWSAVGILQVCPFKRVRVYREIITDGAKLSEIVDEVLATSEELARSGINVKQLVNTDYDWNDWYRFEDPGDPSGATTNKSNQLVPEYQELLEKYGIEVDYMFMATMPSNIRVRARVMNIQNAMQRFINTGIPEESGPAFWVDVDRCPVLDEALRGGYRLKINDSTGQIKSDKFQIEERHPYVDIVDAVGYGVTWKLGLPEQIKREAKQRKSDEQLEDEERDRIAHLPGRRSRC